MRGRYVTTTAAQAVAARLTAQDWQVMARVAALRFVSGDQLARLCFPAESPVVSARAARRALLRLTRLDVLERLPRRVGGVRAGSTGYVYRLGLVGHRLAVGAGLLPEGPRRRSLVPGTLFLRHTLQIAELHTRLVECEHSGLIELLALEAEPSCWRSMDGTQSQRLKPDTHVRLGIGPYEDSYFIEVDRGTEGSRAIARQLDAYVRYYQSGHEQAAHGVFPRVLWLTPDEARAAAIETCIEGLPSSVRPLFQTAIFDRAIAVITAQAH